jgi:hypothetical protein
VTEHGAIVEISKGRGPFTSALRYSLEMEESTASCGIKIPYEVILELHAFGGTARNIGC